MSEHTPGPWRSVGNAWVVSGHGKTIAQLESIKVTVSERKANAYLLAASPELLEAAKKTLENWDSFDGGFIRKWLEEAISKAEGKV